MKDTAEEVGDLGGMRTGNPRIRNNKGRQHWFQSPHQQSRHDLIDRVETRDGPIVSNEGSASMFWDQRKDCGVGRRRHEATSEEVSNGA